MATPPLSESQRAKHRRLRLQRRKLRRPAQLTHRRRFLLSGLGLAAGGVALVSIARDRGAAIARRKQAPIRPPTASPNDLTFQQKCVRCGLCGTVCENGCIRFFGLTDTNHGALTPYIDVRQRSCTLCMRCTEVCPSGALSPVPDDLEKIVEQVDMGRAVVERDLCLSYLGRVCGFCHDACPLPQTAIRLAPPALPVILDGCVGCGRCVEYCPQSPTAISIVREEEV